MPDLLLIAVEYGSYISIVKFLVFLVCFLLSLLLITWVYHDARTVETKEDHWTGIIFGAVAATAIIWMLVPVFAIGLVLYLVAVGTASLVYVSHRNARVMDFDRILTPDHIRTLLGLNDGTADIRYSTAFWVQTLVEQQARYTEDGKLVGLDSNEVRQLVEIKRKLAPILVEHLNDTHFWVRNIMGLRFRNLFKRPVKRERGTRYVEAPTLPDKFDWIRADWHTREKTQKEWNSWWTEHGEEALVFAHPPQ